VKGNPRRSTPRDRQNGSYLGPAFDKDDVLSWAEANGYPCRDLEEGVFEETAELLASEKIVGWFNGRMEFGPRALGARSIIGDARSPTMQSVMNLKIKFRESFRPFAPSCLLEDVSEFFELDQASPYMLLVTPVVESRRRRMDESEEELFGIEKLNKIRSDIPAVTHIDNSARVQTVRAEDNAAYHALIKAFKKCTGYGVIINTSFNVRGEPIVCTPEEAYLCFMRTEMDALVIEGILFDKEEQPSLIEDVDWRELYALD
jgi:carbamoyltransferase